MEWLTGLLAVGVVLWVLQRMAAAERAIHETRDLAAGALRALPGVYEGECRACGEWSAECRRFTDGATICAECLSRAGGHP